MKIVIDDANHVTEPWASVNSRVFDSLACGTLVLTNGKAGVSEILSVVPTFSTVEELQSTMNYYLSHEEERMVMPSVF